ncbi:packaged DNA stabilization gp4 family protein [Xanthomonas sp. NCPPB 1325]|uniref:packaged DNA stabilization gp4 family protein n=1 Tax=Xanthomonas sp. NCPPB 1325 TaxID=487529 RepID=UPI00355899DD
MTTVAQIVARSLRLLRVVDSNEAPEAEDFETARIALNGMMRRWEANGLALGWQSVENPAETLPAPPEAEQAIAYNLAMMLRPEYGANLEPDVVQTANDGLAELRRDMLVANPLVLRQRLPGCGRYNIYTDEYDG